MEKIRHLKNRQEFKFAIIGGLNTILDFAILFSLRFLGIPDVISNIFSTGITFCSSFILNKKITFKSENKSKKQLAQEMISFTLVTLFGLWVIQGLIIYLLSPLLNNLLKNSSISLFISKLIATIFSLIWNFLFYKKVVFKN